MPESIKKAPIKNLTHASANHTPGIGFLLYFALVEDLTAEPKLNDVTASSTLVDNISATGTFTFVATKGFGSIRTAKQPKAELKTTENGSAENTIELNFLDSDEALGFRQTYKTAQMILVYKDANGKNKMFGTSDFPASMTESTAKNEDGSLVVKLSSMAKHVAILPDAFTPTAPSA